VTHRVPIRCNNCSHAVTLRVVVADGHQRFVFACPHCASPLHATFVVRLEPMELRLESHDVEQLAAEDPNALAVVVATEVPVHLGLVGATGKAAMVSPFILVSQELGLERAAPVTDKANRLRALREQLFPGLRRAAWFWSERDLDGLITALRAIPGSDGLDWDSETPMDLFDQLLGFMYAPLEQPGVRDPCAEELLKLIAAALDDHFDAFAALFAEFDVSLPQSITPGAPAAGAGNLETASSEDAYTFTTSATGALRLDFSSCTSQRRPRATFSWACRAARAPWEPSPTS
jgi:hypothetical protein